MIEWVPIKDWQFTKGEEFLVLLCDKEKDTTEIVQAAVLHRKEYPISVSGHGYFDALGKSVSGKYKTRITHIAPINLPVEKTLEEKFEDFYLSDEWREPIITRKLAQIAKEHYEGKE
jgi:hypothetical protein